MNLRRKYPVMRTTMKTKIEVEIEIPDALDPDFLKLLSMLNEDDLNYTIGHVCGRLVGSGAITKEEAQMFTRNHFSKTKKPTQ